MGDYITREHRLQAVRTTKSDGKSDDYYVDLDTGERVERLIDEKFAWRDKKQGTLRLADTYKAGQLDEYADRAKSCSTWLQYLSNDDQSKKQLHHFNACKLRLCPLCAARKARIMAKRLYKIIEKTRLDHPGTQLIFLTLTVENCTGDKLRETLDLLTKAWFKLMHRRPVTRAVKGWFRAIEITRNRLQDTYHPHIHAILVVEDCYFDKSAKLYLSQARWVDMWQQSLQVAYRPVVDVRSTYQKGKKGKPSKKAAAAAAAVAEAAKYATKDAEFLSAGIPRAEAAEVARVYTSALHGKRLTALGGWMLEASQALAINDMEAMGDLVHDDGDGELTEATAELLLNYGWHYGVAEHVLQFVEPNPNYVGYAGNAAESLPPMEDYEDWENPFG